MSHKYIVGQPVLFSPGLQDAGVRPGSCTVTRLLPKEGSEYQYHVQCAADGLQRRVQERQLQPAPASPR